MLAVRVFVVAVMLASASAQSEILALHNAYRERHQVPPLTSSAALTSAAQSKANSLAARAKPLLKAIGHGQRWLAIVTPALALALL
ncbi:hypothetical protein V8C86DRAFT_3103734 [Haematococcus lacustris]